MWHLGQVNHLLLFWRIFLLWLVSWKTIIVTDVERANTNGQRKTMILQNAFHIGVIGYISPYQTVVIVTSHHQSASGTEVK